MYFKNAIFSIAIIVAAGLTQPFQLSNHENSAVFSDVKVQHVIGWLQSTFNIPFTSSKLTAFKWEDCGSDSDSVRITALSFDPKIVQFGDQMTVRMEGIVKEAFSGGEGTVAVFHDGVKMHSARLEVCTLIRYFSPLAACPVLTGWFDISRVFTMDYLPSVIGRSKVIFQAVENNKRLFCFGYDMETVSGSKK